MNKPACLRPAAIGTTREEFVLCSVSAYTNLVGYTGLAPR